VLCAAAVCWAYADQPAESRSFEFRHGIVVAPATKSIYLMRPAGGIEAIDLASGRARWTVTAADRPLLLHGQILLAQAEDDAGPGILRLIAVDTTAPGGVVSRFDVPLPAGISAGIDDAPNRSFRVDAWSRGESIIVSWAYEESRATGGEHAPAGLALDRHEAGGVEIDLRDGRLRELGEMDRRRLQAGRSPGLARLIETGAAPVATWRGDTFHSALSPGSPGTGIVTIKRWSSATGDPLPDLAISTGTSTVRSPSADGSHLLASRMIGVTPAGEEDYLWTIFSLETGSPTAQVHGATPGAWFFISGALLVHEVRPVTREAADRKQRQPTMLRAVDLGSGAEVWSRALRDTADRGPLPAAPRIRRGAPPGPGKPSPSRDRRE